MKYITNNITIDQVVKNQNKKYWKTKLFEP